eukprot:s433_g6.t8
MALSHELLGPKHEKDAKPQRAQRAVPSRALGIARLFGARPQLVMESLGDTYDSLTREHLQRMAKWIVILRGGDESSESTASKAEDVLHEVIAKKFGEGFDPSRTTDGRSNEWQPGFVQIRHYRDAVYRLSKEPQGRQSAWIQQVLRDIAAQQEFHKELLEHEATSDSFAAFTAKMDVLLTNYLTAAKDEVQARESMESFCTHAAYKQHTYLYAQAILCQLRGKCPRQHQALLALSQALTSRGLQRFPSHVSRFDLSLTGDDDAKDLAGLLLSMSRRSGKELATEAAKVCRILERLFGLQDARTVLSPSLQEDRSPSTEVASDATEWGEQVCPDPETEGQPQVAVGPGSPAASSVRDNATAWNSSIQAPSWTARRESEGDREEDKNSQKIDPTKGKRSVQWQLRSPQIFNKLLVQFVDPENEFHPADKRPCAKLLAIVCNDGLTSQDEAVRQSALEAVDEAIADLCAVYEVAVVAAVAVASQNSSAPTAAGRVQLCPDGIGHARRQGICCSGKQFDPASPAILRSGLCCKPLLAATPRHRPTLGRPGAPTPHVSAGGRSPASKSVPGTRPAVYEDPGDRGIHTGTARFWFV